MTLYLLFDVLSISFLMGSALCFLYILLVYFRGMETPPFWFYFFFGFIFVAFHGILQSVPQIAGHKLFLSSVRLLGYLIMFVGFMQLLRSYTSKIKFDKSIKKK